MARSYRRRVDTTFSRWHRFRFPELYQRIGHVLDMADRDWTEFCHFCKQPLAIVEEHADHGQNLDEKSTTITRRLAMDAKVEAYLVCPRMERPQHVLDEIRRLHDRIAELEDAYPILDFTIKSLAPVHGELKKYTEMEAVLFYLAIHRRHHKFCEYVERDYLVTKYPELQKYIEDQSVIPKSVQQELF